MNADLAPGVWYAGIDTPFGASEGMVKNKLEALGLTDVSLHWRDDEEPPNPPVAPNTPGFSNDWDMWGSARYVGAPKTVKMHSAVQWVVGPPVAATAPAVVPAPTAPAPKPRTSPSPLLILFVIMLALRKR